MLNLLILIIIAILIWSKIYKILGDTRHQYLDAQAYEHLRHIVLQEAQNTVKQEKAHFIEAQRSEEERKVFDKIRQYTPNFTLSSFLEGANRAFVAIIDAYSSMDLGAMDIFIASKLSDRWKKELAQYKAKNQKITITVVAVNDIKLIDATINDEYVFMSIEINSEQISYLTDTVTNELISGSKTLIQKQTDHWRFARKLNTKYNYWLLIDNVL